MEQVKEILQELINLYNTNKSNDEKHKIGSLLWTQYYQLCKENHIESLDGYNLSLILESESYIINQEPIRKEINNVKLNSAINHLMNVQENNKLGLDDGISMEEAYTILDWTVENTRLNFQKMGVDVMNSSLNGFCEIGQATTLMPLEELGLNVTKNTAKASFNYLFNHCFGTVIFPILKNDRKDDIPFLIDTTYRQFFTTVRCNKGRYYIKEENTGMETAPDPGYFISDINFAKELMANGYVQLTNDNAKIYGESFYLASLSEKQERKDIHYDYYSSILNHSSNYKAKDFELEGLNIKIPVTTNQNHRIK